MKRIIISLLLFTSMVGTAQKTAKPDAYGKTITAADLKRHLYIVAGPEMEGRDAASDGERKAAGYIENEFKRIGLEPGNKGSYRQFFPLYQDSLINASIEVNGQKFQVDKDFNAIPLNIPATFAFSEAVFIGPNVPNDSLTNAELGGRLVILSGTVQGRTELLRRKGVAAMLVVSNAYPRKTELARTGRLSAQFFRRTVEPQLFNISEEIARTIIGANYDTLKSTRSQKPVASNILLNVQKTTLTRQSSNVIGILPGTDLKNEYVVITAHYDHEGKRGDSVIYYGADDDGSGTVSVIELAEAFAASKKAGKGPRRSIVFMTVSGEEKGLLGSAYYGANPVYPLEKTTVNLNIDMIGRIDPTRKETDSLNYVYVIGDDKISSDLKPISEAANKMVKLKLDYRFNGNDPQRFYYRSDHYNFAKYGVPIIFYFNGTHADYHRPSDTPDKINYPLMEKRARLVFYTAWDMANRNEMLKRDLPLPTLSR